MHKLVAELPDLFINDDGTRLQSPDGWPRRRAEIMAAVLGVEYGHLPPLPAAWHAEDLHPTSVARFCGARHSQYRLVIEGGQQPFWFIVQLLLPAGDGPFPVVINGDGCWRYVTDEVIMEVLGRGYALATFNRTELAPDVYRSDRNTALYLTYPDGDFGALAAWAWGYHRVVDFLLTQDYVNPEQIAVVGHSRGGKCVLLAGATDERIAVTAPNNSGAGGAGCYRWQGEGSEQVTDTMRAIPYWFTPHMSDYIGNEAALPFDQHSLKALVAPRALVSTEALGDVWANPTGTYQTFDAAREAYKFLGAEDRIGIWFREGEHRHGLEDWKAFLDFADLQLRGLQPERSFTDNPFPEMKRAFSWSAPER